MKSKELVLIVTLVLLSIGGLALLIPAMVLKFGETTTSARPTTTNKSCENDCTLCEDSKACGESSGCKWAGRYWGCVTGAHGPLPGHRSPPKTTHTSPKTTHTSPKTTHTSPKTTHTSPKTTHTSPKTTHTSPKTTHTSPKTTHTSPKTTHTSPKTTHTSPKTTHTSPKTTHTSPKTTHTFCHGNEHCPCGKRCPGKNSYCVPDKDCLDCGPHPNCPTFCSSNEHCPCGKKCPGKNSYCVPDKDCLDCGPHPNCPPKTTHTYPSSKTNCPDGWKCTPAQCPDGYTQITNHDSAFMSKGADCYQGDKSGPAICCTKGWEPGCDETCAQHICEKHPNATFMNHDYGKPGASDYSCMVKAEQLPPEHITVPENMRDCFGELSWPRDKLFTVRLPQLYKLQKRVIGFQKSCHNDNKCWNPAIGLTSTSVFFPGEQTDVCHWTGDDARYLFPTPEALRRVNGRDSNLLLDLAADQMWTIYNKSFLNDQGGSELLYQITSNPSIPKIEDLEKSYGCIEGDNKCFADAGLVVPKERISVGIGPQSPSKPVIVPVVDGKLSKRIYDYPTIPVKHADFFAPSEDKGSWEKGSNWLHIDCESGTSMIYIRVLAPTIPVWGSKDIKHQYIRLYLTVSRTHTTTKVAKGTCGAEGNEPYEEDPLPFAPPPGYAYAQPFKLVWLVWQDEPITLSDELKLKKVPFSLPVANMCDESCEIPYIERFQWSIATPPKPLDTCTPGQYYCDGRYNGQKRSCHKVESSSKTQRAYKCYDSHDDCSYDEKTPCCNVGSIGNWVDRCK